MYNTDKVKSCLCDTVDWLQDASIYAPTFINEKILSSAINFDDDGDQVLQQIKEGSITKMMGDVIRIKKITNTVKSVIDDFSLFEGKADLDQKNSNQGRFVGLMLNLKTNNDIALNIYSVAFHADMACPDLKLYLYNSDTDEPISITAFNYVRPRSVVWIDVSLPVASNDGVYYLGYYESDMVTGAQSIKKTLEFVNQPSCSSCNQSYYNQYQKRSKYVNIQPFYVDRGHINTEYTLFGTDKINYIDFNNWGLNIKVSVVCDISSFICRNKALFYDALSMRYALDILSYILMHTRDNVNLDKIRDGIIFLRDGDYQNRAKGFAGKYEEAISALNIDLSGFNELCLPCAKSSYVRRGYIG